MPPRAPDERIALLLGLLDQAFERRAWHGTTLKGALRGLDPQTALWRPHPSRHSVWEYLLHAAYWKYAARRHVGGDRDAVFGRKPSDWPRVPEDPTPQALRRDVAFLTSEHRLLRAAVERFPAARLEERTGPRGPRYVDLIQGVAAHDLYHCGQIQLLKRLRARA